MEAVKNLFFVAQKIFAKRGREFGQKAVHRYIHGRLVKDIAFGMLAKNPSLVHSALVREQVLFCTRMDNFIPLAILFSIPK